MGALSGRTPALPSALHTALAPSYRPDYLDRTLLATQQLILSPRPAAPRTLTHALHSALVQDSETRRSESIEAGPSVELSIVTQGETMSHGSGGVDRDIRVLRRRTPEVILRRMAISRDPSRELTANHSHGTAAYFPGLTP